MICDWITKHFDSFHFSYCLTIKCPSHYCPIVWCTINIKSSVCARIVAIIIPTYFLGSFIFLRESSAFGFMWTIRQPNASRVLQGKKNSPVTKKLIWQYMQRTREAAERIQTEHDGLNYVCPNLWHKKGRAIPTGEKRAPSESDKFPSHLEIGRSDIKSEFDVFQKLLSPTCVSQSSRSRLMTACIYVFDSKSIYVNHLRRAFITQSLSTLTLPLHFAHFCVCIESLVSLKRRGLLVV